MNNIIRKNILTLKPYSSARDEFKGKADLYLDANESPWDDGSQLNRYPDPMQRDLRKKIAEYFKVEEETLFIGNGSDEAIDLLIRVTCEPGIDRIIQFPPTYGMYEVQARIQNADVKNILLNKDFSLPVKDYQSQMDEHDKLTFVCTPNNPTGNVFPTEDIEALIRTTSGLIVVDEAYIDFSNVESMIGKIGDYDRLVVLRTFSKAWSAAGIRLGVAIGNPTVISYLNAVKYPYNINRLTAGKAISLLDEKNTYKERRELIQRERQKMRLELSKLPGIETVFPSEANFLLVRVQNSATVLVKKLADRGIIIRNRSYLPRCKNCVRITIGRPEDNKRLLNNMKEILI
ncbi:histidinol-phosphate transaminase [Fidelibacter multiformis]|uniref:histidinol-phosphate transaminase n=1 Tax=Fidelibacter multiformis TaxID=3377529 RepID=UPI0037DD2A86